MATKVVKRDLSNLVTSENNKEDGDGDGDSKVKVNSIKIVKRTLDPVATPEPEPEPERSNYFEKEKVSVNVQVKPKQTITVKSREPEPEPEQEPEPESESEAGSEPEPEQVAEPDPEPEPEVDQVVVPLNPDTSKPEEEPKEEPEEDEGEEEGEGEYGLHPQLEEILQYLADEEHVSIIKSENFDRISDEVKSLGRQVRLLTNAVVNLKQSGIIAPTRDESAEPTERVTEQEQEQEPVPEPVPVEEEVCEEVDPLKELAEQYSKEIDIDKEAIKRFNNTFDATFVYDFAGRSREYVAKLNELGIQRCVSVRAPKSHPVNMSSSPGDISKRIAIYMRQIIAIARREGFATVNVVADLLLMHKSFKQAFFHMSDAVTNGRWEILQYCCQDHHESNSVDFDWNFYLDVNPDLEGITSEGAAREHFTQRGAAEGRVGVAKIVPTSSNNTLAFALRSSIYGRLESQALKALNSSSEIGLFDFGDERNTTRYMTYPNLFILPGTSQPEARALSWHKESYAF